MDGRTQNLTFRNHKFNILSCHTRNNTDQRNSGCNSSHRYNVMCFMRGYNTITHWLIACDLDKNLGNGNTTNKPQTHTSWVDHTANLPSLASPKTVGNNMELGPACNIPSQSQRRLSLTDYMDLLQRARWKDYHRAPKAPQQEDSWTCISSPYHQHQFV
jgi:hypothetical protein